MKKLKLLLLFIGLYYLANSQTNYLSGYIITTQNDTVYGLIKNSGDYENSRFCHLKNDNSITKYSPDEINGYRFIDGKYYISKEVKIEGITEYLFLEFLLKGEANLFYYRNLEGDNYLIEKDNQLVRLKRDISNIEIDDTEYHKNQNKYIGTLKFIFKDASELRERINKVILSHKSLISLTKQYHQYVCTDDSECIIYEKKISASKIEFAPTIGINYPTINYQYNSYDVKTSSDPSIEIGISIRSMITPNKKFNLCLQSTIGKYKLHGMDQKSDVSSVLLPSLEINNEQLFLKNKLLISYSPSKTIGPIIQLGVWSRVILKSTYDNKLLVNNNPVQTTDTYDHLEKNVSGGLTIGTGIEFKKRFFLITNINLGSYHFYYSKISTKTISFNAGFYL